MNSVIFGGTLSILLGLLVFAGSQAINAVFALSTVGLYFAYLVPIAARFMGGNELKPGAFNLGILVSGYMCLHFILNRESPQSRPVAVIAVLFMTFMSVILLFPPSPNPDIGTMNYTVLVFGSVMVFSLVWYYLPKYGGAYWFTGPVRNIDVSMPLADEAFQEKK